MKNVVASGGLQGASTMDAGSQSTPVSAAPQAARWIDRLVAPLRRLKWAGDSSLKAPAPPRPLRAEDVRQDPRSNACYLIAPLIAITHRYPEFIGALVQRDGDRWAVRGFEPLAPCVQWREQFGTRPRHWIVHVKEAPSGERKARFSTIRAPSEWVAAVESAHAGYLMAQRPMYGITRKLGWRLPGYPNDAMQWLLGCEVEAGPLPNGPACTDCVRRLIRKYRERECVLLIDAPAGPSNMSHAYAVVGVDDDGIEVRDPKVPEVTQRFTTTSTEIAEKFIEYVVTRGAADAVARLTANQAPKVNDRPEA